MMATFRPGMTRQDAEMARAAFVSMRREIMRRDVHRLEPMPVADQIVDAAHAFDLQTLRELSQAKTIDPQRERISVQTRGRGGFFGEGLGDTIASVTKMFGIKPCSGCERRRKMLNKLVRW